jgi:hypothetical protein
MGAIRSGRIVAELSQVLRRCHELLQPVDLLAQAVGESIPAPRLNTPEDPIGVAPERGH